MHFNHLLTGFTLNIADAKLPQILPDWSAALPLWSSESWLWITLSSSGQPVFFYSAGQLKDPDLLEEALSRPRDLIVLDCRVTAAVSQSWWPKLQSALLPGGVLFVCGRKHTALNKRILGPAHLLVPGLWHVIEPQDSGYWRLRPDNRALQGWFDRHLTPPLGLRSWLKQIGEYWVPIGPRIACLPVWRVT